MLKVLVCGVCTCQGEKEQERVSSGLSLKPRKVTVTGCRCVWVPGDPGTSASCFGILLTAVIQTAKKKEDSFVTTAPLLKFIGMLGILLTFLVFNIMLAGAEGRDPQANWRIGSLCFHVVLPILYIADWFLFYERKQCKWYYPIASIGFPLAYVIFLLIQAIILDFNTSILIPTTTTPLIYPYFFVNIDTQGIPGVLMWIAILTVAFVAVGYLFYGLDRILRTKTYLPLCLPSP